MLKYMAKMYITNKLSSSYNKIVPIRNLQFPHRDLYQLIYLHLL